MLKLKIYISNKILNINEKYKYNAYQPINSPLILACIKNNLKVVRYLINYANDHNIKLNINDKDEENNFPFLSAVNNNNIEMVRLLIDYANKNYIVLNITDENKYSSTLLTAVKHNNTTLVQLLINYANDKNKTLDVNKRDKNGNYPLLVASKNRNIGIVRLIVDYANDHDISLNYDNKYLSYDVINILKGKKKDNKDNKENITQEVRNIIERELREKIGNEIRESIQREIMENEERKRIERAEREEMERGLSERFERESRIKEERERERSSNNNNNNDNNNDNNDNNNHQSSTMVIATRDFIAEEYDQLDIKKDEFLIVTDWNCKEGWIYGHRKDNPEEKGLFPKVFIKIYEKENNDNSSDKFEITPEYKIQFERKINELRSQPDMEVTDANLVITINRNSLFINAYENIMNYSPVELKKRLKIKYENEEGLDAGGLLRDFFYHISKEIGNPNYSLFEYPNDNTYELVINPKSGTYDPNHLSYFRFVGRILGLTIFHRQYLSVNFTLLFYKRLLEKPLEMSDIEFVDPEIHKNMNWLKENEGAENLCLSFELDTVDCFGNHKKVELKPNGATIDVTDDNKDEYIDLVIKHKLNNTNDKEQFEAIKYGFYEIIPKNINTIINEFDLKYLLSGINEINVDDWENNTDYEGYTKNDITIVNFWKCVRDLNLEKQVKLLLFATGNSQVPVTGFKDLQGSGRIQHFKLKKTGTIQDLPVSHTCFNRIDLPPYTSYTQLKQKLLLAISEGNGGFNME